MDNQKKQLMAAVRQVLNGDRDAYETIYNQVDRALRAFIRSRSRLFGEDFVDEAALRTHVLIFQNLHKYNPDRGRFMTWLFLQARNAMRLVRGERFPPREVRLNETVHQPWVATASGPAEEHEALRRVRVVREELESLSGDGRDAVVLHDLEGRTFPETARKLGIPVGRLRYQRDRALAVLKRRLQERGVHATERDITPVQQVWGWDQSGYDDDWTCSVGARLPVEPSGPLSAEDRKETPP